MPPNLQLAELAFEPRSTSSTSRVFSILSCFLQTLKTLKYTYFKDEKTEAQRGTIGPQASTSYSSYISVPGYLCFQ